MPSGHPRGPGSAHERRPAAARPDRRAPQPVTLLRRLLAVADGSTTHVWNGSCLDSVDHCDSDPTCPACAVLDEAQAFLTGFAVADPAN